MLKDNFVDIYKVKEGLTINEVIEKYRDKKLELITIPTHPLEESESAAL